MGPLGILQCTSTIYITIKWKSAVGLMVLKKTIDFIADFEHVAMVLEKNEEIDEETFKTQRGLIDIFAHVFYKKLKPSEIVHDLYSQKVLSKETFDAVRRDEQNNGESSAAIILIDNIWRFHKNWFNIFLEVLCKYNYKYIVKEIDPSFLESKYIQFIGFVFCFTIINIFKLHKWWLTI